MDRDREGAVRAVLTEMAEEIAAAAPRGWKRAELHGYAVGQGGAGHRGFRFEPKELNEYGANDIDVFRGMGTLHALMEADEHLTIDLELEARGRYHAVLSERLDRAEDRGFRYLLDKASEPPECAALQAGSDAAESGDPDEAVALLAEYVQRLARVLDAPEEAELPSPLSQSDRQEIADELEIALPRDLNALYAVADGDGNRPLWHGFTWFGLETLSELCDEEERWWVTRGWRRYVSYDASVNDYGPPATIRRMRDHPAWIPFATDQTGDFLAVDMAPGPHGRPGQVILIGRNQYHGPVYVAESVTDLLRSHVEALAPDRVKLDDDGELWINAGDLYHHKREYDSTCMLEVTGPDAAPVRGLGPETRQLAVRNAPWVDLSPVRDAPALWKVSVSNCAGLDLSPLLQAPVEVVDLGTDTIELSGLQGHPTVSQVVLHSAKPVDLRPLASCPHLYALDLTDAPMADISGLGQLTGLRYLRMLRPQWEEFLAHQAIPASLAVAELAEEPLQERKLYWSFDKAYQERRPTLKDALDWAERLTGNSTDIVTLKGKFKPPQRR